MYMHITYLPQYSSKHSVQITRELSYQHPLEWFEICGSVKHNWVEFERIWVSHVWSVVFEVGRAPLEGSELIICRSTDGHKLHRPEHCAVC